MRSVNLVVAECLALTLVGCSPWLASKADALTSGAVAGLTSQASQTRLAAEETKLIDTARDEALSAATELRIRAIVDALAVDLRDQLVSTRDALLTGSTGEVDALRDTLLGARTRGEIRALVRDTVDEALGERTQGEINAMIDGAMPHLQVGINQLVDGLVPKIEGALNTTSSTAEKDLATLKMYFVGAVVGIGGLLVLALIVIAALVRAHTILSKKVHSQLIFPRIRPVGQDRSS